jgi:hypothetical protein
MDVKRWKLSLPDTRVIKLPVLQAVSEVVAPMREVTLLLMAVVIWT